MVYQILTYQTFNEYNHTDLAGLLTYPAQVVPTFIPLVLTAILLITMMATFFSQKRMTGRGDFFSSFASASFFTFIIALSMTLVEGLINITTLTTSLGVLVISVVLLFLNKEK